MSSALGQFLEVCHDGPTDLDSWLKALLPMLGAVAAPSSGISISQHSLSYPEHPRVVGHWGRAESLADYARAVLESPLASSLARATCQKPFRVSAVSERFGAGAEAIAKAMGLSPPKGVLDHVGLLSVVGDWWIVASIPKWTGDADRPTRRFLLRLQRHMASAAVQRHDSYGSVATDAIFDESGRLVHDGSACGVPARVEQLARAFANDLGAGDDDSAEALWESLWQGGFAIARVVDTDGKRLIVLRRVAPRERVELTPAETRVVRCAVQGASLRAIAADLGTTLSTASLHLRHALDKLGLRDRVQLVELFASRPPSK